MKKYFFDKNTNDSKNMKLILSNQYNGNNKNKNKKPSYNKVNNVILPRLGDRTCLPYMTVYKLDYNTPKYYKDLLRMNMK
jgi:hypothetical protein